MGLIVLRLLLLVAFVFCVKICFSVPVTGNPKGAVRLIEYYDYECPHCRRMEPVINALEAQYPELQVTHRVTPLLTPDSRDIASLALAASVKTQSAWQNVHDHLMSFDNAPTFSEAMRVAKQAGFNAQEISAVIQNKKIAQLIDNEINHNIVLANHYAVDGVVYLPILVFEKSSKNGQTIVLRGEQPYKLLSAIVRQLAGLTD